MQLTVYLFGEVVSISTLDIKEGEEVTTESVMELASDGIEGYITVLTNGLGTPEYDREKWIKDYDVSAGYRIKGDIVIDDDNVSMYIPELEAVVKYGTPTEFREATWSITDITNLSLISIYCNDILKRLTEIPVADRDAITINIVTDAIIKETEG